MIWHYGAGPLAAALACVVAVSSLWIIWSDITARRIPNAALVLLALVWLIASAALFPVSHVLRSLGLGGLAFVIGVLLHQRGLAGGGDVKLLVLVLGLVPGWQFWTAVWTFYGILVLHLGLSLALTALSEGSVATAWRRARQYPLGVPLAGVLLAGSLSVLAGALRATGGPA